MSETPTPSTPNRRRCRRLTPKGGTKATCFKGTAGLGKNLALLVLDLSEEGIRMLVTDQLAVGQEIEINLENVNQRKPLKIAGRVAWAVPAVEGSCCIGVRFERSLRYAEVVQFVRTLSDTSFAVRSTSGSPAGSSLSYLVGADRDHEL